MTVFSKNGNNMFNAIAQSNIAMAEARGHYYFKKLDKINAAEIRKFVVNWHEKSQSESLHESIIACQLALHTHHGKVWKSRKDH